MLVLYSWVAERALSEPTTGKELNPGSSLAKEELVGQETETRRGAVTPNLCTLQGHSDAPASLLPDWDLRPHRQWEVLLLSRLFPNGGHVRR